MSLVLATGGLGYIGSHTCIDLISEGYDVLILDSLINSPINNLEKIKKIININKKNIRGKLTFQKGDLKDKKWLDSIFKKQILLKKPIESVIHFAGLKSVQESVLHPLRYWEENINATLSLISVMEENNCRNIVFSSSATIYKPILGFKLTEDSIKEPINPYGNSKLAIEKIFHDVYNLNKNWKIINLRYFNPVGVHNSAKIGEVQLGTVTNLFPILEKVVSCKLDKLMIYGKDWPTFDGTCVRDYIHVMDLSRAHLAALKYIKENDPQSISINIGTGMGLSVLQIINAYSRINNVNIPFEFVNRRVGDTPYLVADNSLALELLDWKPLKSIEDICADSFRFIKESQNF